MDLSTLLYFPWNDDFKHLKIDIESIVFFSKRKTKITAFFWRSKRLNSAMLWQRKKMLREIFLTVQRISKSENVEFLDSCWFIKVGRSAAPPICRTKDSQKTKDCHFRSRRHLFSTSLEMQKKINSNWREEKFLSGKKYLLFGVVERN